MGATSEASHITWRDTQIGIPQGGLTERRDATGRELRRAERAKFRSLFMAVSETDGPGRVRGGFNDPNFAPALWLSARPAGREGREYAKERVGESHKSVRH